MAPVNQDIVKKLVVAMFVVLGVIIIAQGSLAIQTYNTLGGCTRGEASSKPRNDAQIALLTIGVAILLGTCITGAFMFKKNTETPLGGRGFYRNW